MAMVEKMSKRILIIDDCRPASIANKWIEDGEDAMVMICRTYEDGLAELKASYYDILMLDHDLGCFTADGKEQNGYHILCFLEENPQYLPGDIIVVTSNASVWDKMDKLVDRLYGRE